MKILVTGNKGYIGSVLTKILVEKGYSVVGLDTNFYTNCRLINSKNNIAHQIIKDIRNITENDLRDIDGIIHLAALSNDPLGEFNSQLTYQINFRATVKLARLAKKCGVKRFVYASSQSMYGISNSSEELDEDNSIKNPITEYAKTKWSSEQELKKMNSDDFTVVCFRPSTVFGASPNLRCDIVYNNLVACAYTTGKIEIKSDGTPWRPVIHIRDVSNAFIAGLEAPKELVSGESFNVGIENGNYTIRDLAEAAQKSVPGSKLIFTGEHGTDSRTYKVSFKKILTVLKDYYKPEWNLSKGGEELVKFFKDVNFTEKDFRGYKCNRIIQLKSLIHSNQLNSELYWKSKNYINTINQAVILAGGQGTRLRPITNSIAKPMVKINEKPFLEYLIDLLKENGIKELILLLGYLPETIQDYFEDGSKFGIKIKYSVGDVKLDTAKRIQNAKELLNENFLLMYCDNYWPLNLKELLRHHNLLNKPFTISAYSNNDQSTKSNLLIEDGIVKKYDKSRIENHVNSVDIGYFIMNKSLLNYIPNGNTSLGKDVLPTLVKKKLLSGFISNHKYYSIGDLTRLPETEEFLKHKKIIFLDRDGVINEKAKKRDYIKKPAEFNFLPGVKTAIRKLTENNYDIFVITNQPGIAKKVLTLNDLKEIHDKMISEIKETGGNIKDIFFCPHNWNENCFCRKPEPGMFFDAAKKYKIDLSKTIFIGDDDKDLEAGENAGIKTFIIDSKHNLLDIVNNKVLK